MPSQNRIAIVLYVLLGLVFDHRSPELARAEEADPPPTQGTIRISHEAKRVTECRKGAADAAGESVPTCEPAKTEPQKSGAQVKLKAIAPVGKAGLLKPIEVKFEDSVGKKTENVLLTPGSWELSWTGRGLLKDRFRVAPGDQFEIILETQRGVCSLVGERCALEAEKLRQSVEIPEDRGLE